MSQLDTSLCNSLGLLIRSAVPIQLLCYAPLAFIIHYLLYFITIKRASTGVRWCSRTGHELQYSADLFLERLRAENAELGRRAVELALEIEDLKAQKQRSAVLAE
jgi:hypothetical protein